MIPSVDFEPDGTIPDEATFWVPGPEELGEPGEEGGIGWFRDTWYLGEVSPDQAGAILAEEEQVVPLIGRVARTAAEYDLLAGLVEFGNSADDLPRDLPVSDELERVRDLASYDVPFQGEVLEGLELGVAGLVYALTAFGAVTAASCRGHYKPGMRPWADRPVVFFAAPQDVVEPLASLVAAAGCGFGIDDERPNLLMIEAPSVLCTMRLARAVVAATG